MTKLNKDEAGNEKLKFTWNHINFEAAVTARTDVARPDFTTTSLQQHQTSFVPAKYRNININKVQLMTNGCLYVCMSDMQLNKDPVKTLHMC